MVWGFMAHFMERITYGLSGGCCRVNQKHVGSGDINSMTVMGSTNVTGDHVLELLMEKIRFEVWRVAMWTWFEGKATEMDCHQVNPWTTYVMVDDEVQVLDNEVLEVVMAAEKT